MAEDTTPVEAPDPKETKRDRPQPEGQTIPSGQNDEDFPETVEPIPVATEEETPSARKSKVVGNFSKLTGIKASEVLSFNEDTHVVVTEAGGKYQLNKKGDKVRHLAGPEPPKSREGKGLGDKYVDARANSPFTGTAALINASTHESPSGARAEVANQLAQDAENAEAAAELARERAENAEVR